MKFSQFFQNSDLKKIGKILLLTLSIILLFFFVYTTFSRMLRRNEFVTQIARISAFNEKTVFSVDKIVLYSSASGENINTNKTANWTLNVHQYTDIALYINNKHISKLKYTDENTVKELYIDEIHITPPELGVPYLTYKDINNFGKFIDSAQISERIDFTILDGIANIEYAKPEFYNTCATPITLGYVNKNVKSSFVVSDVSQPLIYDGSLLKRCNVSLESVSTQLSFTLHITNNLNQKFSTSITIDIPLRDEKSGIDLYSGNMLKTLAKEGMYKLYRTE